MQNSSDALCLLKYTIPFQFFLMLVRRGDTDVKTKGTVEGRPTYFRYGKGRLDNTR
jgi:hypothetical protein